MLSYSYCKVYSNNNFNHIDKFVIINLLHCKPEQFTETKNILNFFPKKKSNNVTLLLYDLILKPNAIQIIKIIIG